MPLSERQLKQLIHRLRQYQDPKSWQRRKGFAKLQPILQELPGIVKYSGLKYQQALDLTWEWVSLNICNFEPRPHLSIQKSLERWINEYLHQRLQELAQLPDPDLDSPRISDLDNF